jgi:protein O-mannosyl-transferase
MKSLRTALPVILILIVIFAAFFPCLKNGFVNWDDGPYVTENPVIRHFSGTNIARVFSTIYISSYLPVTMLSYMLDYRLFGMDPFGYHLTSLIFHLLNCLLVFWLFRRLSGSVLVAFLTALFWGIHPLRVESVAWVSERKDVLYTCFFLLSMICYCRYLSERKVGTAYGLSVVFFALSLLSKAMAIVLPPVLLLTDHLLGRKFDRGAVVDKAPFLVLSLGIGAVGFYGQMNGSQPAYFQGFFERGLASCHAIFFYLNKLILPVGLSCLYPSAETGPVPVLSFPVLLCFAILLVTVLSAKRTRKVAFGVLFFLITLFPVLKSVPTGAILVQDRYLYLASIGLFYLAAEMARRVFGALAARGYRTGVVITSMIVLTAAGSLLVLTRGRCAVWRDGITLWTDVLNRYPQMATAHNQRGLLYAERKDPVRAIDDYKKLLSYAPRFSDAYINLGCLYMDMGENDSALGVFEQGLKAGAAPAPLYNYLAITYSMIGDKEKAASYFKKTLTLAPKNAGAWYELGRLYEENGKNAEAIRMFQHAAEIDPGFLLVYPELSRNYQQLGVKAERVALFRRAIAADVPFYEAYFETGQRYLEEKDPGLAIRMFERATQIEPSSAEAWSALGEAYCAAGRMKKAILSLNKALTLDPVAAVVHNNLAVAYYYDKQFDRAIRHCDKATELGYKVMPRLLGLLKPYRKL